MYWLSTEKKNKNYLRNTAKPWNPNVTDNIPETERRKLNTENSYRPRKWGKKPR